MKILIYANKQKDVLPRAQTHRRDQSCMVMIDIYDMFGKGVEIVHIRNILRRVKDENFFNFVFCFLFLFCFVFKLKPRNLLLLFLGFFFFFFFFFFTICLQRVVRLESYRTKRRLVLDSKQTIHPDSIGQSILINRLNSGVQKEQTSV